MAWRADFSEEIAEIEAALKRLGRVNEPANDLFYAHVALLEGGLKAFEDQHGTNSQALDWTRAVAALARAINKSATS